MKQKLLSLLALTVLSAGPALAEMWTNALVDNDFANWANWNLDASASNPTSWIAASQNWQVNLAGADRAVIGPSQIVTGVTRNVLVGDGEYAKANSLPTGQVGELLIDGGTLGIARNLRLGRDTDTGSGTVTVDNGGTLNIGYGLFVGQNANAGSSFNLLNGTVNVSQGRTDGLRVAHFAGGSGTVNVSGGQLNVKGGDASFSDGSTSDGASSSTLNLSGSGAFIVENGYAAFGGNTGGVTSAVTIAGSATLGASSSTRFGFGANSTVSLDMSGGAMNVPTGFVTFGQGDGAQVDVTMSGGEINADRMIYANNTATATLTMTGGTINLTRSGASTATTTGGFATGPGNSALDVGGTAVINAEKLHIASGGVLTISGDAAVNIAGSTDGTNPTFDFSPAFLSSDWTAVLGKIAFDGGSLQVAGAFDPVNPSLDYATLLNAAVGQGVIYTTMAGMVPFAQYDMIGDYTEVVLVVPEPATLGLVMAGAVLLLVVRRRLRSGR